ncbi:hypothetical protein QJS04_geneDACA008583 [Acorus gramineus]|uniref:Clp R domain-containing protein n=1 Tax=Acorus gramineus TaxID=55184 RepID=A0AAV9AHP5_ACOGR|nr:hypothetical protein QJS04_geneDACA008583 [Acorus gramineus]
MRTGGCTVQQALTAEAATVVKQAVTLARRRGHAQVTPLHVANTMLSSSAGLLRSACLRSHSHPLQCKALELCFNVALNRLPTTSSTSSSAMMGGGGGGPHPSLSNALFISLPLINFGSLSREEVEVKVGELRRLVKGCGGGGVVVYLGDMKWAAEYRASCGERVGRGGYYCPVEHVIMEVGRLACGGGGGGGEGWFCVLGIATYQTYMKCRVGNPSLEALWCLHPITIPAGGLGLSLNTHDSDLLQGQLRSKRSIDGSNWSLIRDEELACCKDCSAKFDMEIRYLANGTSNHGSTTTTTSSTTASSLPSWLQLYKQENNDTRSTTTTNDKDSLQVRDLCKKWNSICNSLHNHHHKTLNFPVIISPSTSSISSHDHQFLGFHHRHTSASSTDTMEMDHHHHPTNYKELSAENLNSLSDSLERVVPWHANLAPDIAGAVLRRRSGLTRRRAAREDTWLFFLGGDMEAKEKACGELARLVFGSRSKLVLIGLGPSASSSSTTRADSSENGPNKRSRRSDAVDRLLERFTEEVQGDPRRVFLLEEVEQLDHHCRLSLRRSMEEGRVGEAPLGDAIVVLSCEGFDSRSRTCSPTSCMKEKSGDVGGGGEEEGVSGCISLDLNLSIVEEEEKEVIVEDVWFDDDVGLLEAVDGSFFFKLREDHL